MGKRWIACALFLAGIAVWAGPAAAQQVAAPGPEGVRLVEEVAGLKDSLDHLAALLERVAEQQRVDLLLKRIELEEGRMMPVASDLRTLEGRYEDQKAEVKRYQQMLEQVEKSVSDEIMRGSDRPDSQARQVIPGIERELQLEIARSEELERRMRRLEDELAEGRRKVAILDEQLQEMLDD